ncbi:MAG TPA: hypothetical protein ENH03_03285 [Candidatus Bathyarchaeota archaeon]|nr:hypothetical protein [Candidatus Bathyarchaeota archaeon]
MKASSLLVLLALLPSSAILAVTVQDQTQKYLNIVNRLDDCYRDILDDLCYMMELALKFRDDPNYNYDPLDMERIIMDDGVNGTQELIDLFNEIMNITQDYGILEENITNI